MPSQGAKRKRAGSRKRARKTTARSARGGNRRSGTRKRKLRAEARSATYSEREESSWSWPDRGIKFVLGLLLLPLCFLTTETFFETVASASSESALWIAPEFLFFLVGGVLWLVYFVGLPEHRPIGLYVWGHEMAHAIAATLFGAKVSGFRARKSGGYIYTSKSNFVISLAPYLLPFYTVILLAITVLAAFFIDMFAYHPKGFFGVAGLRPVWVLMGLVGFTWSFHLTFTVWMIARFQPDLEENGNFFSLVLIYLCNLAVICVFVLAFSEKASFGGFLADWMENARDLRRFAGEAWEAGLRLGGKMAGQGQGA